MTRIWLNASRLYTDSIEKFQVELSPGRGDAAPSLPRHVTTILRVAASVAGVKYANRDSKHDFTGNSVAIG